jgi:hypothetical protein
MRPRPSSALLVSAVIGHALLLLSCGGGGGNPNPITPTPVLPSVSAVSPNAGTTLGGTVITVTGANFAAGAAVTVGGAPATNVVVSSATTLTATTAARAAGSVEVTVSVDGRSGTLPAAFTYVAPGQVNNDPPVIQTVAARGVKPNEPAEFADVGEEIDVVATVTDKETPADRLVYEWSGTDGTFSGTGPQVKWRAPASGATPFVANLKLTVVDRFQTTDGSGLPITFEHRVEKTFTVKVHDSVKEVGGMATLFLENFSKSSVPVNEVMKDFLVGCYGTAAERQDVIDDRENFTRTSYSIGPPTVKINFGGTCAFRNRPGDACSDSAVQWTAVTNATGKTGSTEGIDQVAAVYRQGRWWLCDSQYNPKSSAGSLEFLQFMSR